MGYNSFETFNMTVPDGGPRVVSALLDFTGGKTTSLIDLTNYQDSGVIDYIQTAYIDNWNGTQPVAIKDGITGQVVHVPANSALYIPILSGNPCILTATIPAGVNYSVPIFLSNAPIPPALLAQSAGIVDAPSDGNYYVRQNGLWVNLSSVVGYDYVIARQAASVAHTGDTALFTFATLTIPANALGANGFFELCTLWQMSLGSTGGAQILPAVNGTAFGASSMTAGQLSGSFNFSGNNRGVTNSQIYSRNSPGVSSAASLVTSTIDTTTTALSIQINGQLAVTTDLLRLCGAFLRLMPGA